MCHSLINFETSKDTNWQPHTDSTLRFGREQCLSALPKTTTRHGLLATALTTRIFQGGAMRNRCDVRPTYVLRCRALSRSSADTRRVLVRVSPHERAITSLSRRFFGPWASRVIRRHEHGTTRHGASFQHEVASDEFSAGN